MSDNGNNKKNRRDLLQITRPLLDMPESETVPNYYVTRGGSSYAAANPRLDTYSLVSQPAVGLSYSPPEKYSKLLDTRENSSLFVQANVHPALFAVLLSVFPMEVFSCSTLHGNAGILLPLFMCFGIWAIWKCTWTWQKQSICSNRSQKSREFLKIPDRLLISCDGIQFMWTTKHNNFASYALRWSKMRLVYLEKSPEDADEGYFICIRMSSGGLLRLHSSGFASKDEERLFAEILLQHAPQAFKDAPLYLAVQPERTGLFSLRWSWFKYYCRNWLKSTAEKGQCGALLAAFLKKVQKSRGQDTGQSVEAMAAEILASESLCRLSEGCTLQNGRYKILKRISESFDHVSYLAEAIDPGQGDRIFTTYGAMGDGTNTFGAQTVLIHEYMLPPMSLPFLDQEDLYSRLLAHSGMCARLDNKRILRWLDHFVLNGRGYIVFEYCPGLTIRQHVKEQGPLTEKRALGLALQLADILAYLHNAALVVVHGNLTPDNLTIDPSGNLKLISAPRLAIPRSKELGGPVGRLAYMAPEQMRGAPCKQSDLYALGAIVYFMLTGEDPAPLSKCEPKLKVATVSDTMNALAAHATEQELPKRFENIDMLKRHLIQSEAEHLITRLIS